MDRLLEVKGLAKSFGGVRAIDNLSLEIFRGDLVGVIGPNGAGKTTLINLISGFLKPDGGKVIFEGKDVTGWPPYKIASLGIARTFQHSLSFGSNPVENVMLGLFQQKKFYGSYDVVAIDLLEDVGFDRRDRDIYLNMSSQPYGNLKRIELARTLALKPKFLLLDEPFSGLNKEEINSIIPLVVRLNHSGVTIVIVEHRVGDLVSFVKRLVVMSEGRIIADGVPTEVVDDEKVKKAYFGELHARN